MVNSIVQKGIVVMTLVHVLDVVIKKWIKFVDAMERPTLTDVMLYTVLV